MLVIDASVALKWVLEEDGSAAARQLLLDEPLAAPELLWVECANVLWVKARRRQIEPGDAALALAAIEAAPIRVVPSRGLPAAAQSIAFELDQTVYDCLYLAAALVERAKLVTADDDFARVAGRHPVYGRSVQLL